MGSLTWCIYVYVLLALLHGIIWESLPLSCVLFDSIYMNVMKTHEQKCHDNTLSRTTPDIYHNSTLHVFWCEAQTLRPVVMLHGSIIISGHHWSNTAFSLLSHFLCMYHLTVRLTRSSPITSHKIWICFKIMQQILCHPDSVFLLNFGNPQHGAHWSCLIEHAVSMA